MRNDFLKWLAHNIGVSQIVVGKREQYAESSRNAGSEKLQLADQLGLERERGRLEGLTLVQSWCLDRVAKGVK